MNSQIKITKDFGPGFRKRSGLHPGTVVEVEAAPPPDDKTGQIWVRCPPVPIKCDAGFLERSDGYTLLTPDEYREV